MQRERGKRREKGRGRVTESCLFRRTVGRQKERDRETPRQTCFRGLRETRSGQSLSLKGTVYPGDRAGMLKIKTTSIHRDQEDHMIQGSPLIHISTTGITKEEEVGSR